MINDRCEDFEEKIKEILLMYAYPGLGFWEQVNQKDVTTEPKIGYGMRKIDLRFNELRITLFRNIKFQVYI
jgi:hypothetical protein